MIYNESLEYIRSLQKFGSRPGLDAIRKLCEALGNPQEKLKFVHVAGTNGKGSTCNFIAKILESSGFKTGLHTSPYISSPCEMFQINGANITESDFARLVGTAKATGCTFTEYELYTAIVFLYFLEQNCDYVVLEVGMGGLLDSTNIIPPPEVAVITPIGYDHMGVLGNTIAEISAQKCGIIKENCKVVTSRQPGQDARSVIRKHAPNATLAPIAEVIEATSNGTTFAVDGEKFQITMLGTYQAENAATAITVAKLLGCPPQAIAEGLINTKVPCRFEVLQSENPIIIRDGAHNSAGAKALADSMKIHFPNKKITLMMGMLSDKDCESCVEILAPIASEFIAITPNSPRALPANQLAAIAKRYCDNIRIGEQSEAFSTTKAEVVCLCGSFTLFK